MDANRIRKLSGMPLVESAVTEAPKKADDHDQLDESSDHENAINELALMTRLMKTGIATWINETGFDPVAVITLLGRKKIDNMDIMQALVGNDKSRKQINDKIKKLIPDAFTASKRK